MKRVDLKEVRKDDRQWIRKPADVSHGTAVLDEAFIGVDEKGVVQLVYAPLPDCDDTDIYEQIVKNADFATSTRVSGLTTTSVIFGFQPPRPTRQRPYPSATSYSMKHPKETAFLAQYFAKHIMPMFKEFYAENLDEHMRVMQVVHDDWIMKHTVFTGGVINKSNQLNYHTDIQNIPGSINAMPYFTRDVEGGELVLPRYDARLVPKDRYVLLFRNDLLHGVAPILHLNKWAYRYSVVYYLNKGFEGMGGFKEELEKSRTK